MDPCTDGDQSAPTSCHVRFGYVASTIAVRALEGDGWVDWSGLATFLAEVGEAFVRPLRRLTCAAMPEPRKV